MKLPSVVYILSEAKRSALRFPLALLAGAAAAAFAIALVDGGVHKPLLTRLLLSSMLGLPFLIALPLFAERRAVAGGRPGLRLASQLFGLLALVAYFFSLPEDVEGAPLIRFLQLNVGLHLLVAFLPYLGFREEHGFWQFNKTLFLRLLAGAVFSITLATGLSVALLALDKLFGVPIDDDIYPRLWYLVIFVFNTWYFLGGIPRDFAALESSRDYPLILKVFAQYILAPLVGVYLILLSAYLVKVLATTEWPSGWIGYLVSSVAAAGLFSLVLLYPIAQRADSRWIRTYSRLFHILLLPATGMLLAAIYKRIAQYGITENRYFLAVLAAWLVFVSLRNLIAKRPNLKLLPLTLCVLALFTSFGPWGAYSVSRNNQSGRLTALLEQGGLLVEGKLAASAGAQSFEDRQEISAIFDYLLEQHGVEAVSTWLDEELSARLAELDGAGARKFGAGTRAIMSHLGLEYVERHARSGRGWFHSTREYPGEAHPVGDYELALPLRMSKDAGAGFEFGGIGYTIPALEDRTQLSIRAAGAEALAIPLEPVFAGLHRHADMRGNMAQAPGSLLTSAAASERLIGELMVLEIHWWEEGEDEHIEYLEAILFLAGRP